MSLEALLRAEPSLWRGEQQTFPHRIIPTGFRALDHALPGAGWQAGRLTELLPAHTGHGEFSLLLPALAALSRQGHWIALVHPPFIPYPPALLNAGIDLDRTLITRTDNDTDTLWAAEQLLRAGSFPAVICWLHKTSPRQQRRLQLAAEAGHCWAVAYRPFDQQADHSPAALRILIRQRPSYLELDIRKSRGGRLQQVTLPLSAFDEAQGVEWPVCNATASGTETAVRLHDQAAGLHPGG